MSYITLKCKNCGSNMTLNTESNSATCIHCGSTFLLSEILDEKDMAFASQFTPKNLEKKMMAQGAIKQGETHLFQGEFEKAETSFKRAIDLDDTNYKSYLGVVKAKTHNLNIIPENDDYIQYAHYAISLASGDDLVLVQSELAKIEILRREGYRQKKIKASRQKQREQQLNQQRRTSKFILFISIVVLSILAIFLFFGSFLSATNFDGLSTKKSIDIDSYESLQKVFSSNKFLDYEINITKDINCGGRQIQPLGTKTNAFTGSFNGNKHTISNLKITTDIKTCSNYGFFGYTSLANINNIIFDNVDLEIKDENSAIALNSCGILAGTVAYSTVKNIEIKDTCDLNIQNIVAHNPLTIGGLVGYVLSSSHLSQISCHTNITTSVKTIQEPYNLYLGGIVGYLKNSNLHNTCSNSNISASLNNTSYSYPEIVVSGIIGFVNLNSSSLDNIKNNFFSGSIYMSSSNTSKTISAIAYTTTTPTSPLSNYCLFAQNKFKYINQQLSVTQLGDYTLNNYFTTFCNQNSDYIINLQIAFSSWKNATTLTPSLV